MTRNAASDVNKKSRRAGDFYHGLLGTLDANRWLEEGWFYQNVDLGVWAPPPGGEQDTYQRSLAPFIGEDTFFIEWRMHTDGDSTEIGGVAPASLVTGTSAGVSYHFTIARDQARFIRDNSLRIVFANIDPDVPHTHRRALYGAQSYLWYTDGVLVDSGTPEGAFPTSDVVLSWRAKSWYLNNMVWWEYIRYGTIPVDASGDFDSDGDVDDDDLYFFQVCLLGPDADGPGCRWVDMNGDGFADGADIRLFVDAMLGPWPAPIACKTRPRIPPGSRVPLGRKCAFTDYSAE